MRKISVKHKSELEHFISSSPEHNPGCLVYLQYYIHSNNHHFYLKQKDTIQKDISLKWRRVTRSLTAITDLVTSLPPPLSLSLPSSLGGLFCRLRFNVYYKSKITQLHLLQLQLPCLLLT